MWCKPRFYTGAGEREQQLTVEYLLCVELRVGTGTLQPLSHPVLLTGLSVGHLACFTVRETGKHNCSDVSEEGGERGQATELVKARLSRDRNGKQSGTFQRTRK